MPQITSSSTSSSAMFQPFENVTDFYPGLIAWCDPYCYEMDIASRTSYDRKKSRELRPCLVISVNYNNLTFQAARLSASTPNDPTQWVKIDSPPPITWKLNDAWIWVSTPATVAMVFDNAKIMHRVQVFGPANKDTYYSMNPVATTNLQNYWVHRQAYISRLMRGLSTVRHPSFFVPINSATLATSVRHSTKSTYQQNSVSNSNSSYYIQPPASSATYSSQPDRQSPLTQNTYFNQPGAVNSYHQSQLNSQTAAFNTLAPHPVVVPPGFTETRQSSPGWWRNPQTGWLWHASRGLLPPSPPN
ncbi:hypothetical protein B0H17DRAFT_1176537 [Mycena rosella]|uniref:Uncharacterized protein n=1 Tax=Mycena rosella TaxID=1033263 RepID=A0AAD7DW10_MYCRO|nr:hypothetical protein B0H17DRAFT_1176537 [Mycena rosella]